MYLATFIAMSLRGNVHVRLGCTKPQSPRIGTVLHWRPPDVHIFHQTEVLPTLIQCDFKPYTAFTHGHIKKLGHGHYIYSRHRKQRFRAAYLLNVLYFEQNIADFLLNFLITDLFLGFYVGLLEAPFVCSCSW